jgi:RHS repeat-associated protein
MAATITDPVSGDVTSAAYAYDALGRRISKTVDGVTTVFICDGAQVIEERVFGYGQNGTPPSALYVYGSYVDEPIATIDPVLSDVLYYHGDHRYSVQAITDSSGSVVERYAYTPYGEMVVLDAAGAPKALQEPLQPYGYTGRRFDSETGLWYFRARYFDSDLGRFISRDPLRYVDGLSLYRGFFVPSNMDPSGLRTCSEECEPQGPPGNGRYEACMAACVEDGQDEETSWPGVTSTEEEWDDYGEKSPQEKFTDWVEAEKEKGEWWKDLPKCPCSITIDPLTNPNSNAWQDPAEVGLGEASLHPGAVYSMRSRPSKEGHSNQCTYDCHGRLITTLPGAGSVDWQSPDSLGGVMEHYEHDVRPVQDAAALDGHNHSLYPAYLGRTRGNTLPFNEGRFTRMYYGVRPSWHQDCPPN